MKEVCILVDKGNKEEKLKNKIVKYLREKYRGSTVLWSNDFKIKECSGCLKCWLEDSDGCIKKDDYRKLKVSCMEYNEIIILSKISYGMLSYDIKNMLDRGKENIEVLSRFVDGKWVRQVRVSYNKKITIIGYGESLEKEEEEEVFLEIIENIIPRYRAEKIDAIIINGETNLKEVI